MVIAFDGTVLFKNDYENAVYAVTRDGALRWKYKFPVPQQVIPVLDGAGTLFTGGFDGRLFATNSVTGGEIPVAVCTCVALCVRVCRMCECVCVLLGHLSCGLSLR